MAFDTPVLALLLVVFASILEVFLLCLAGYVLAWKGILDKRVQKALNRMNISLFTPSLLFVKVAFFLSPGKLRELWIIPIFWVILNGTSFLISYTLGKLFLVKKSQRSFAMAASMFMNSNSFPTALMQSLVISVPGLKWGEDDNKDIMLGRALTYLVFFSTLGMMLRWSFGVRLLTAADDTPVPNGGHRSSPLLSDSEVIAHPSAEEQQIFSHSSAIQPSTYVDHDNDSLSSGGNTISPERAREDNDLLLPPGNAIIHSFPNSPTRKNRNLSSEALIPPLSSDDINVSDQEDDIIPVYRRHFTQPTSTRMQSIRRRFRHRLSSSWTKINQFMSAPLWASLLSLFVACVPPFQHIMEDHVQPIKGALTSAGNCSIPLTLVVLGAYFYTPPDEARQDRPEGLSTRRSSVSLLSNLQDVFKLKPTIGRRNKTLLSASSAPSDSGETTTVIIAVSSRMIITPLLLLPLMALSPVFVVSTVLLIGCPVALTLAQISHAASNDAFERLISRTIFWSYCILAAPAMIVYVVIGLLLAKL
ncbi:hypothetical protein SERLA73DRAFT_69744 [Serpula lacrymans var. lacrymans S7.3]|uniref:Uncharacterized protein n=1 Tax=Serpula lacrymans var. lacrymans (strain S7.3) TaxID=936435 RepID=F8PL24_SERL3|nr:hypothetical protein SERLA73DRAFT_69744 [Serpula lacrymans var. lacrymans S7.3]